MRCLAAVALLAACESTTGTVRVELTTAPGSAVLDPVTRLRLTFTTDPPQVDEAARTASGFDLALSFGAEGQVGSLIVEGYDDAGTLLATGASPPFSIGPTDARIVIYIAAPLTIGAAPVALGPARSSVQGVTLPFGVVFAGGRDPQGVASDAVAAYNAYDHTIDGGLAMPIKRADFAMGATTSGLVYFVGGLGADGNPVATVLQFNTTVAPSGSYVTLGEEPAFARAGDIAVPIGTDRFLISGTPPGELAGGELAPRTEVAALPAVGTSLVPTDAIRTALFVGDTGLVRFRQDRFDSLAGPGRARAAITDLWASHRFLIAGGGSATVPVRDVLVVDPSTGVVETKPDALVTPRFSPALAATDRYIVVAGGLDAANAPIATAEVLDATTFAPVATLPIAPRTGAHAFPLGNGQVLIAGGSPATDLIELFTPPPP